MSYQNVIFVAAAVLCLLSFRTAQAASIKPLPAAAITDTGNIVQVYYYRYHYRYHERARYHHYRYY